MTPDSHSVTQGIGRLARLFNAQRRSESLLQTFSCVKKFSRLVPQSNSRDRHHPAVPGSGLGKSHFEGLRIGVGQ
ncbi:MAG TPA: hypothetical protein DIC52_11320 [Candidatus Latescibacteria bacterium]|nr:hypothetical protein [Candidatus Latescibacterota bacterium]